MRAHGSCLVMYVSTGASVWLSPSIVTTTVTVQSKSDDEPFGCVHLGESATVGVESLVWPVTIEEPADKGTIVGDGNG